MDSVVIKDGPTTVTFRSARRSDSADPYAGESFVVELESDGIQIVRSVFMFGFEWQALAAFFEDLAESWKGWDGSKQWNSVERDLEIEAAVDHLGHCELAVIVRNGRVPTWMVRLSAVTIAAGEDMANLAREVSQWTTREASD